MYIFKRIIKLFMILVVLLFIGISVFFLTFDLNMYKGIIVSKASQALNRQVKIDSMAMKLSLIPTIEVKGITIANTKEYEKRGPLLKVDSMDVTLALIPLLKGTIELKDFNLSTATVILVDRDGQNNYTFGKAQTKLETEKKIQKNTPKNANDHILNRLSVDNITIKKLSVSYVRDLMTHSLSFMNVSVEQLRLIKATVVYNGKTVKIDGNLGNLAGLATQKPNYSFQMTLDAFDAITKISGTIGDTTKFAKMVFNISSTGKDLKKTVGYFSKANEYLPALPFDITTVISGNLDGDIRIEPLKVILDGTKLTFNGQVTLKELQKNLKVLAVGNLNIQDKNTAALYGVKPLGLTFDVVTDLKGVVINKMTVMADKTEILMNGTLNLTERIPTVKAQIAAPYFDLNELLVQKDTLQTASKTASKTAGKSEAISGMFSSQQMNFSALKKVNASVALTAQYVKVPQIDNIGLSMKADLKGGNLEIPSVLVRTPVGTVKGKMGLDASSMPAKVNVNLSSDALKLDEVKVISNELKGSELWAAVNFETVGDSPKSFVSHLNGQIMLEVTEGEIVNKWFNALPVAMGILKSKSNMLSFSTADQISQLVCGAINLPIRNGVITSQDQIAVETSAINFLVSGSVSLPQEELSLTMVPSVSNVKASVQDAMALTQVVKISGPFSKLSASVDTKKVAQTALTSGLNAFAGKIAEKQGVTLPAKVSTNSGYNLCEKVLGRPLAGQIAIRQVPEAKKQQKTQEQTTPVESKPVDAKDIFKKQLLDSLTEALKK